MSDFETWMEQLGTGVAQIDEIKLDQVDSALQSVHALLQEHSEKQPLFNTIYSEVKTLLSSSTPEEALQLNEVYSDLVSKYQVQLVYI